VSLFRFVKYSSILYLLGKHRDKLFRSVAVLLFALVTSLLYDDLRVYLESQHPETLVYALVGKVVIVYGAFVFVLLQFRPSGNSSKRGEARASAAAQEPSPLQKVAEKTGPVTAGETDRLAALEDVDSHGRLRTRYERVLAGEHAPQPRSRSSMKSRRS
jgi:hypothetical protein